MTDPIQRLRDLLAKATPGTWVENRGRIVGGPDDRPIDAEVVASTYGVAATRNGNAALIVAAVNALPALLDVAEAAKAIEIRGEPSMSGGYHTGSYRLSHMQSDALERLVKALAKLEGIK